MADSQVRVLFCSPRDEPLTDIACGELFTAAVAPGYQVAPACPAAASASAAAASSPGGRV
jgi:hypothetical protein